jgi:hypothetical protein
LLEHERDGGGDGEDQDQRAFDLAQQQPQRAQAGRIFDTVRPDGGKLRGRPV